MNDLAMQYLQLKAKDMGLSVSVSYACKHDAEIITLTDGSKTYQFGVTGLEMMQNDASGMKGLIDCRFKEALKTPRKPRFDSVNPPISEMPQRGVS